MTYEFKIGDICEVTKEGTYFEIGTDVMIVGILSTYPGDSMPYICIEANFQYPYWTSGKYLTLIQR